MAVAAPWTELSGTLNSRTCPSRMRDGLYWGAYRPVLLTWIFSSELSSLLSLQEGRGF
jgi:hypothetical protein